LLVTIFTFLGVAQRQFVVIMAPLEKSKQFAASYKIAIRTKVSSISIDFLTPKYSNPYLVVNTSKSYQFANETLPLTAVSTKLVPLFK